MAVHTADSTFNNLRFTTLLAQNQFGICDKHSEQGSEKCLPGHHESRDLVAEGDNEDHTLPPSAGLTGRTDDHTGIFTYIENMSLLPARLKKISPIFSFTWNYKAQTRIRETAIT